MLKLTKTALAVVALSSSAVFAGTMGPVCSPGNVTVPCERSAWDFAGQALYLQQSLGDLNFAGYSGTTDRTFNNLYNKWGWGFYLEGSYHFSTGNDIDLNWYHLDNKRSNTFTGPFVSFDGTVLGGTSDVAYGTVNPSWDLANLELAQHIDFSPMSSVRMHGGVSYVRIYNKSTANVTGTTVSGNGTGYVTRKTDYNGFGPRVGADAFYGFGNGLQAYASSAMALYAGTLGASSSATTATAGVFGLSSSAMRVVPSLQAKLGGTYTYSMAQGDLTLDAGWLWLNYFNAISTPGRTIYGNDAASSLANIAYPEAPQASNFGLQGPYVGLKWVGNVV